MGSECDKMLKVKDKSQTIGEFLEWLREKKNVSFCILGSNLNEKLLDRVYDEEDSFNEENYEEGEYRGDEFYPTNFSTEKLLAEFFEIDLEKVETEKREMLDKIRNIN